MLIIASHAPQDHNTSKKSCAALDGALCATHARVQQRAQSDMEGRHLVSKSDVVGESCLPRSCIQAEMPR